MSHKTITKDDISKKLQEDIGLSNSLCEEIVNSCFENIIHICKSNKSLTIKNFGRFHLNEKKARPGQNIKTGETVIVPERTVLRFTPARSFKQTIQDK